MEERGLLEKQDHTSIDFTKAIDAHTRLGGNRYTMILEAAFRARQMFKRRDELDRKAGKLHRYDLKPLSQAVKDIIEDYK